MGCPRSILLVIFGALFIAASASAQTSVVFTNNDGTFTYDPSSKTMNLGVTIDSVAANPGLLTAIGGLSGFGVPDASVSYNPNTNTCSPMCLGNITFTTGALTSGTVGANTGSAHFGMGGDFMVSYSDGVSFSGSFSRAKWIEIGTNTWAFTGFIVNGVLTIPLSGGGSETFSNINAGTIQLTDTGNPGSSHPNHGGVITFKDSAGSTNFSVAPEPGTLTLFGGGLIALGIFTRRRLTARSSVSQS